MNPEKTGPEGWSLEAFTLRSGKKSKNINPKLEWINTMVTCKIGNRVLMEEAKGRTEKLLLAHSQYPIFFRTVGSFVTGLGRNHPVENGFVWHHTLGVPYIPGSSVKGLVRAWATSWDSGWGSEEEKLEVLSRIFGPRRSKGHSVGSVVFLDAIPVKPVQLKADIMTPHYGPYYQGDKPPADWHSPVPIPFLVVDDKQEFQFGIMPRRPQEDEDIKDCETASHWLIEALENIGAGAKTSVGYGRFEHIVPRSPAIEWLESKINKLAKEQNKQPSEVLKDMHSKLADSWSNIKDPKLKYDVQNEIVKRYRELGLWDDPPTRKMRKTKRRYEASQSSLSE